MTKNEKLLYIQSPGGEYIERKTLPSTKLAQLAADFFDARGWPTSDSQGRNQRAVVELVDPEDPNHTKRLRSEQTVDDAGLWDGAILRIFPESIAGGYRTNDKSTESIRLYIETLYGDRYETTVPIDTLIGRLARDFFESQGWPVSDSQGRNLRAVVELVDPDNPDHTKQLRSEQTMADAGLWDGAILRIFPEYTAGCFAGSVKVSLANGEKRQIQNIRIGDLLLSGVPGTDKVTVAEVARVFRSVAQNYLVLNDMLLVTESHPVWVNGEWKDAGELQVGDLLRHQSGRRIELRNIERRSECVPVFNLYLSSIEHTFFAEEILVHNQMLKEANALLKKFEIYEQTDQGRASRISRQEYELLQGLVKEMEKELTAQREEIWALEERIKAIENNLAETARAFEGISDTLSKEQRVVFMKAKCNQPSSWSDVLPKRREDELPRSLVRLKIDREMEAFGEADQQELINTIAHQVKTSEEKIRLLYITAGCVTVMLEMSADAAADLVKLVYGNPGSELAALGVKKIEVHQLPLRPPVLQIPARSSNLESRMERKIRNLEELQRRADMYGPGKVPLEIFNQIAELEEQIQQLGEQLFEENRSVEAAKHDSD